MSQATDARLCAHYQVVYLKSLGHDAPAIAEATGYSQNWVRSLLHRYNADGEAGLRDRCGDNPGARPLLDRGQRAELEAALAGRHPDGGLWSGPKVARWIVEPTGRERANAQQGWAWLRRLGYTPQRPRTRHAEAELAAQAALKKLTQRAQDRPEAERWAMDEHRIGLKPIVRAVGAKRGERPVVSVQPRYEWLYVYGFVRPETGETSFWLTRA